jgi:hypothetical protein
MHHAGVSLHQGTDENTGHYTLVLCLNLIFPVLRARVRDMMTEVLLPENKAYNHQTMKQKKVLAENSYYLLPRYRQ